MGGNDRFYILALDGGGARGIYAAQVLAKLEGYFEVQVRDCFDLIVGTSTGAIIAGAAATGIKLEEVVGLFECNSAQVFQSSLPRWPFFQSKYASGQLAQLVRDIVPDVTLGEIPTPLMITSSDISTGGVHVFKSRYLGELGEPYVRDGVVQLSDAILASCSAPAYFDPACVGSNLLADGGLWANNPSIIALVEAVSKFGQSIEQVRILSIGTGHSTSFYGSNRFWGLLTGWGRQKLVSYVLGLQSQASANMSKLLLEDRYFRLDPEIENWDLDDIGHLDNLKSLADRDFTHKSSQVKEFLRRN